MPSVPVPETSVADPEVDGVGEPQTPPTPWDPQTPRLLPSPEGPGNPGARPVEETTDTFVSTESEAPAVSRDRVAFTVRPGHGGDTTLKVPVSVSSHPKTRSCQKPSPTTTRTPGGRETLTTRRPVETLPTPP